MDMTNNLPLEVKPALDWAFEYLIHNKHSKLLHHENIAQTSYSSVYKIITSTDAFYLKKTPPELNEFDTLVYLLEQGTQHIPTIVAESKELCCFLMKSCGDLTLRTLFKEKIDLDLLNTGVLNYTTIQRSFENKVPQLLSLNMPDWRLKNIPKLYLELINQTELLLSDGISKDEFSELQNAYQFSESLCESLSKYQIPETINHCDFQENNMVLERKTGNISIIDWGETVITHPFLSLSGCLWNMTYFNGLNPNDDMYTELQCKWIAPWLDLHQENDVLDALRISTQLTGIFAALSYQQMYEATKAQKHTVQQEHPGSIVGCLRSFLLEVRKAS